MPPISTFQPLIVRTLYVNVPFTNDSDDGLGRHFSHHFPLFSDDISGVMFKYIFTDLQIILMETREVFFASE